MLKTILGLSLLFAITACWLNNRQSVLTQNCLWMYTYLPSSDSPLRAYKFYNDNTLDYYSFCNDSLRRPEYPCKVGRDPDRPPLWRLNGNDSIFIDGFWYRIQDFTKDRIILTNMISDTIILKSDFESFKKQQ